MSRPASSKHGQVFSLAWALALALALSAMGLFRMLATRVLYALQPPIWAIVVVSIVSAVLSMALLFWGVRGANRFIGRAHRRRSAWLVTAGVGGVLGAVATVLTIRWDIAGSGASLSPVLLVALGVAAALLATRPSTRA